MTCLQARGQHCICVRVMGWEGSDLRDGMVAVVDVVVDGRWGRKEGKGSGRRNQGVKIVVCAPASLIRNVRHVRDHQNFVRTFMPQDPGRNWQEERSGDWEKKSRRSGRSDAKFRHYRLLRTLRARDGSLDDVMR